MNKDCLDTDVPVLGESKIVSPIRNRQETSLFVSDTDRVTIEVNIDHMKDLLQEGRQIPSFEMAGPREKIYFDPSKLRCALVTCGGLCPGLNDIIRAIVLGLHYAYGVRNVYGIRYGLQGFIPKYGHDFMPLTPEVVSDIWTEADPFSAHPGDPNPSMKSSTASNVRISGCCS